MRFHTLIERRGGEQGFAMVFVLVTLMVASLLVAAALSAAQQDARLTENDLDQKQAYIAAKAGIADYQFFIQGAFVDLSTVGNRRKFIDGAGKPVDPATAAAAFGTPIIRFSGDHTGFATNLGGGGAFTLVGSLTNASTGPSD